MKNGGSLLTRSHCGGTGRGPEIWNPCNGADCNVAPASRTLPGAVIPTALLTPQAQALLKFVPLPNVANATGATPNYAASGVGIVNWDGFDARVDRYQTEKLHMFGRYSFLQVGQTVPGAFGFAAGGPNFATTAFAGQAALRDQKPLLWRRLCHPS